MAVHRIDSLEDSRLDPYRSLKTSNLTRDAGQFIAEGDKLAERLVAADWPLASLLSSDRWVDRATAIAPPQLPVYLLPHELMQRLVGFEFHRGLLTCAWKTLLPSPEDLLGQGNALSRIVVTSELKDPGNLGCVLRSAAAFGWNAAILGPQTPDPFSRRVLRTSMGAVLQLPLAASTWDESAVEVLRSAGFAVVAAVLADDAVAPERLPPLDRIALVLGNEGEGLPESVVARCTHRAMIPIAAGVDSLNVAAAAAVLLYALRPAASSSPPA